MEPVVWETRRHESDDFPHVRWHETQVGAGVLRLVEDKQPGAHEHVWGLVLDDEGVSPDGVIDLGKGPYAAMIPQPKNLEAAKEQALVEFALWRLES